MKIESLKNDFFYVENFIPPEECQSIINYLEWQVQNKILEWNQISFYGSMAMGYWPYDENLKYFNLDKNYFNNLKEKIKKVSEEALGIELSEVSYHAQKWVEGAFAGYHSDNSDENGNPTAFERSKYAVFLYLNDNFDGGNLKFKNYDIDLKPKTGLIAIFAGGHGNEHMVTTVSGGSRYTVGSFWDDAKSQYSEEKRKAWDEELAKVRAEQEVMYKTWEKMKELGSEPTLSE
jgi:2OG-Fe(II) oxygenase superfamily